eukprot:scaffold174308_cov32-Tisochrysis_lutea.AAC.5
MSPGNESEYVFKIRASPPLPARRARAARSERLQLPAGAPGRLQEVSSGGSGRWGWAVASPASPSLVLLSTRGPLAAP